MYSFTTDYLENFYHFQFCFLSFHWCIINYNKVITTLSMQKSLSEAENSIFSSPGVIYFFILKINYTLYLIIHKVPIAAILDFFQTACHIRLKFCLKLKLTNNILRSSSSSDRCFDNFLQPILPKRCITLNKLIKVAPRFASTALKMR